MHPLKKLNLVVFLSSLSIYLWTFTKRHWGHLQLGAYNIQPRDYLLRLGAYITDTLDYAPQLTAYITHPLDYLLPLSAYITDTLDYAPQLTAFITHPLDYLLPLGADNTQQLHHLLPVEAYNTHLLDYLLVLCDYITNPLAYVLQLATYITNPLDYLLQLATYIPNPLAYVLQLATYIPNPLDHLLQLAAYITYPLAYLVTLYQLINGIFYSYASVCLLWILSILYSYLTWKEQEELPNQKVNLIVSTKSKVRGVSSDSIVNAEKFLALFHVWLRDEEIVAMESEPLGENILRLQSAMHQMKRVQIIMDSLQAQSIHQIHSCPATCKKIYTLLDQFDYIKAYTELRLQLLKSLQRQFSVFLEGGKELKIQLSEAMEVQEALHQFPCDSRRALQQQLSLTQVMQKQYEMMNGALEGYAKSAKNAIATLQDLSELSQSFRRALGKKKNPVTERRWSDTLRDSISEEMTQVTQRYSTLLKLNKCYETHLLGLYRPLP